MPAAKIRRVDDPACSPQSPLLRDLSVVRAPLVAFLDARDVVALLATSRTLRDDDETVAHAVETNAITSCFFGGCLADWCAATPTFTYEDCYGCDGDHVEEEEVEEEDEEEEGEQEQEQEQEEEGEEEGGGEEEQEETDTEEGDEPVKGDSEAEGEEEEEQEESNGEEDDEDDADANDWTSVLSSPARRVSLLSLAMLMQAELAPMLYTGETACVHIYYAVPFILPLARLREIATETPPPGSASQLGCHVENFTQTEQGVACAFCAAVASAVDESTAYRAKRDTDESELETQLQKDGFPYGSERFQKEMDAFRSRHEETDERYDEDKFTRANLSDTFGYMCVDGKLPHLQFASEDEEHEMLSEAAHDEFVDGKDGFCQSKLRLLVAFFQRNGFGKVHRTMLDTYAATELNEDEIRSVEMVGAEAPHGFFAGVYFMARYT